MIQTKQNHTNSPPTSVVICVNRRFRADQPSCAARGSVEIADALERGIAERGIDILMERICCLGECTRGPNVRLVPGGSFYFGITLEDVPGLLDTLEKACGRKTREAPIGGPPVSPLAP